MRADLKEIIKFEIEKISPSPGDLVMIRIADDCFDKFGPDELNQLAQELDSNFREIKVFFASESYRMELINKTQLKELGLQRAFEEAGK